MTELEKGKAKKHICSMLNISQELSSFLLEATNDYLKEEKRGSLLKDIEDIKVLLSEILIECNNLTVVLKRKNKKVKNCYKEYLH